jgi:hypothetical protein
VLVDLALDLTREKVANGSPQKLVLGTEVEIHEESGYQSAWSVTFGGRR